MALSALRSALVLNFITLLALVTFHRTFLYAYPIQQALLFVFGHELKLQIYIPTAMFLALFAGIVSWFSVERWFLVKNPKRKFQALGAPAGFAG